MLTDLTPEQLALAEYMSEISETTYHSGWEGGLEYHLWHVVQRYPLSCGRRLLDELDQEHLQNLKALSDRCGGWIVYDDATAETFVPMDAWKARYETWRARRAE